MNKLILVTAVGLIALTSCVEVKLRNKTREVGFDTALLPVIEEMSTYAVLYCLDNNTDHFSTEDIRKRSIRKKMYQVAARTYVYYKGRSNGLRDSTVIFETEQLRGDTRYRIEYWYDFAANPVRKTEKTEPVFDNSLIRVNDRVYYRINKEHRDRFPMM